MTRFGSVAVPDVPLDARHAGVSVVALGTGILLLMAVSVGYVTLGVFE